MCDDASEPKKSSEVPSTEKTDMCSMCDQPFSAMFQNLRAKVGAGRATQRHKHTCRICTRIVCSTNSDDGCASNRPVPLGLWSRKLTGTIRKPDAKLECAACQAIDTADRRSEGAEDQKQEACSCSTGWVCNWCAIQMDNIQKHDMFGVLAKAEAEGQHRVLDKLVKASEITWLLKLDCEWSDDMRRVQLLNSRTQRLLALLRDGTLPPPTRPPPKTRELISQIKHSALRTAEESFNILAGGKLKLGLRAARIVATGYQLSELFTQYLLSEEFMVAWNMLLEQLGEFVEDDNGDRQSGTRAKTEGKAAAEGAESKSEEEPEAGAEAGAGAGAGAGAEGILKRQGSMTQKAAAALDLAKRFYYFSLHHISQQQREMGSVSSREESCPPALLDSACKYMHLVTLLYKTKSGGQPSLQPEQEAAWFLESLIMQDGFRLVDYCYQSGEDVRRHSRTRGVRWPAFAVLVNPSEKTFLVAVRGTQEKHDHLIDIDLAGEWLFEPSKPPDSQSQAEPNEPLLNGKVHRGMVKGARYILETYGLRRMIHLLPPDYKVRLGGHSLGAGTVALLLALIKADPQMRERDVGGFGFGMPACMEPALALKLKASLTSVIHREDIVPRLSFTNLVHLRQQFNDPEEKAWCKQQLEEDYQCLWNYVGWSQQTNGAVASSSAVVPAGLESEDAAGAVSTDAVSSGAIVKGCFRNIAGDLIAPGRIIYLRERSGTGEYEAVDTDCRHAELQRILAVSSRALHDHSPDAYIRVLRGLKLKARLALANTDDETSLLPAPAVMQSSVLEDGSWRACGVCQRDVTDIMVLKSDAHRAMATVHCRQCGCLCCKECAPAADSLPDFTKELWAVRYTKDRRMVLPELATLEAQRLCVRCQTLPSFCT